MNAFFSILLIVGLVQRVLTFLLPSLFQFAKINEQFDSHKSILQQNLYRLEHLKIQFAFYINPSAAEKQFETNRISSENNKMEIYNKIVYEKIQQFHNEKKQFKEYEKNQQEKEQQFNHRNSLYNGSEPEETEDKFSIQEEYFEQLISQYKDIIYLMDNNPRKHKIYSMNLIPITYQLIYLFVITYTSSLISTVIKMYAKDVQQQCT